MAALVPIDTVVHGDMRPYVSIADWISKEPLPMSSLPDYIVAGPDEADFAHGEEEFQTSSWNKDGSLRHNIKDIPRCPRYNFSLLAVEGRFMVIARDRADCFNVGSL